MKRDGVRASCSPTNFLQNACLIARPDNINANNGKIRSYFCIHLMHFSSFKMQTVILWPCLICACFPHCCCCCRLFSTDFPRFLMLNAVAIDRFLFWNRKYVRPLSELSHLIIDTRNNSHKLRSSILISSSKTLHKVVSGCLLVYFVFLFILNNLKYLGKILLLSATKNSL